MRERTGTWRGDKEISCLHPPEVHLHRLVCRTSITSGCPATAAWSGWNLCSCLHLMCPARRLRRRTPEISNKCLESPFKHVWGPQITGIDWSITGFVGFSRCQTYDASWLALLQCENCLSMFINIFLIVLATKQLSWNDKTYVILAAANTNDPMYVVYNS